MKFQYTQMHDCGMADLTQISNSRKKLPNPQFTFGNWGVMEYGYEKGCKMNLKTQDAIPSTKIFSFEVVLPIGRR